MNMYILYPKSIAFRSHFLNERGAYVASMYVALATVAFPKSPSPATQMTLTEVLLQPEMHKTNRNKERKKERERAIK